MVNRPFKEWVPSLSVDMAAVSMSIDDCLEDKREDYLYSVLYCESVVYSDMYTHVALLKRSIFV